MSKSLSKLALLLINNAVSFVTGPLRIKREGMALIDIETTGMVKRAEAERVANEIKSGKARLAHDGKLVYFTPAQPEPLFLESDIGRMEPTLTLPDIMSHAQSELIAEKILKDINLSQTILVAANELNYSDEANDSTVDNDWFHKWKHYAETVSDDGFQLLWGRVLAGEVTTPGSYSPRTLQALHNLTQHEANAIEKIAGYVCFMSCFLTEELEDEVNMDLLLELEELGIITSAQSDLSQTITSGSADGFEAILVIKSRALLVTHPDKETKLTLDCFKVTRIGMELIKLCDVPAHEKYFHSLGKVIKDLDQGFEVQIGDWRQSNDKGARITNLTEI